MLSFKHTNNNLERAEKEDLLDTVIQILALETVTGRRPDDNVEIPSWRVTCVTPDGATKFFLLGRNPQRDAQLFQVKAALDASPGEFAVAQLTAREIESKARDHRTGRPVGKTTMFDLVFE